MAFRREIQNSNAMFQTRVEQEHGRWWRRKQELHGNMEGVVQRSVAADDDAFLSHNNAICSNATRRLDSRTQCHTYESYILRKKYFVFSALPHAHPTNCTTLYILILALR